VYCRALVLEQIAVGFTRTMVFVDAEVVMSLCPSICRLIAADPVTDSSKDVVFVVPK
jgi:hypothetical protein